MSESRKDYTFNKMKEIDAQLNRIASNSANDLKFIKVTEHNYVFPSFGNVGVIMTNEGVIIVDSGLNTEYAEKIYMEIRRNTIAPIKHIIYTHGHFDHVNSAHVFKEKDTQVIAHENVIKRFQTYNSLMEHTTRINAVQFQNKTDNKKNFDFIYPDIIFNDQYHLCLGGKDIYITHGKGETDDHCFVYLPDDHLVYCGDFFIWSFPNIGNPLKVIRYEREWFEALEKIMQLQPKILVPGHGEVLYGKEEIQIALSDVIDTLRFIHEEVILHLNKGTSLEDMLELIKLPENLQKSKYVRPSYGCLEFAIRGTYRRYAGWFDGNATNLRPKKSYQVAVEICSLINDPDIIIKRSKTLVNDGNYQMALHLLDLLVLSEQHPMAKKLKREVVRKCADASDNFIMRNIYKELSNR
ncbi:alkyl sulfatase dimerization domain-containing protein [Alkalihalobacterium sp. APHAB7]|uniref:alkyl sulfatase dimerization domain-containing protein n=1 Tax=Alkalihalobacterium sp. APHAB7 TaxID=3402081 RepID=UPI003AAA715F